MWLPSLLFRIAVFKYSELQFSKLEVNNENEFKNKATTKLTIMISIFAQTKKTGGKKKSQSHTHTHTASQIALV